jgi:hypothetical protein
MPKEIEINQCNECESGYRLVYDLSNTSGYSKFCPFCSAEIYNDDDKLDIEESED